MSRQSAEGRCDLDDYLLHLDDRLGALSKAYIAKDCDLELMILDQAQVHCAGEHHRVSARGPAVRINPEARILLSLGVHELALNAVKFGALSTPKGRVEVHWSPIVADGRDSLRICWKETGVTLGDVDPPREGFGFRVLREWFSRGLDARTSIVFEDDGISLASEMPWSLICHRGMSENWNGCLTKLG